MARVAPYGTWDSPITVDDLVADVVSLSFPLAPGGAVHWLERRPAEGGRQVVVRLEPDGRAVDVVGPDRNVRTLVHEYGGLAYAVHGDTVWFCELDDQRLYRVRPGRPPEPVTPAPPAPRAWRYANPVPTPDGRILVAVRERHPEPDDPAGVVNDLVLVPADGSAAPTVAAGGHDFFAHPAVSPDGRRLAWISWDHPAMPWDATCLWEAPLDGDRVGQPRLVAGGPGESVTQPAYGPDGRLYFVSDRTGWWNLYVVPGGGAGAGADGAAAPEPLAPMAGDVAEPDWVFGQSSYAVLADGAVVATWSDGGLGRLGVLAPGASTFAVVEDERTSWSYLRPTGDHRAVVAVAGGPAEAPAVVRLTPAATGLLSTTVLRRSRAPLADPGVVSRPRAVTFETTGGEQAHALFYPPHHPGHEAPPGERPPLVVRSHGGPTSAATPVLDLGVQFWTSRGFAVVDVNYRGSSGFGRAYRRRLDGGWGVVDVDDCVAAARHLAAAGVVDGRRTVVRGSSAGGYTTLCACTFHDVFAAGASLYGIADVAALARDTHKFEAHYVDGLIGPWPEAADLYRQRSPLFHTDRLRTPLIVFQGLEDRVVPPNQAEALVAALEAKGVPHAYVVYADEGHGFRRAENIRRTAQAELAFYGKVLGIEPADQLPPLDVRSGPPATG